MFIVGLVYMMKTINLQMRETDYYRLINDMYSGQVGLLPLENVTLELDDDKKIIYIKYWDMKFPLKIIKDDD